MLTFRKMQGCGNDFVVLTNPGLEPSQLEELSKKLCDRHFGVGSDGLMVLLSVRLDSGASSRAQADVLMFNPDGSRMGMCGNGIRCLTRYLFLEGFLKEPSFTVDFRVWDRPIVCEASEEGRIVRVDMGVPRWAPADIPVLADAPLINTPLQVLEGTYHCTTVSMGNPHCVVPVESVDVIDLEKLGPAFEHHPLFPDRVNVEFVEVIDRNRIRMRVWERGAGITLACGTGACASVVACSLLGLCEKQATVDLQGGTLLIQWEGEGTALYMTGEAAHVFSGEYDIRKLDL